MEANCDFSGTREGCGWVILKEDKDWKKRYIQTSSSGLTCYSNDKKKKTVSNLNLANGFSMRTIHNHERYEHVVSLNTTDMSWVIAFATPQEMDLWGDILNSRLAALNVAKKKSMRFSKVPSGDAKTEKISKVGSPRHEIMSSSSGSIGVRGTYDGTYRPSTRAVASSAGGESFTASPRKTVACPKELSPLAERPLTDPGIQVRKPTKLYDFSNVAYPREFPPPPAHPGDLPSTYAVEEYKLYMKKKNQCEIWENGLRIYLEKEKQGDKAAMARIIQQLNKDLEIPSQISELDFAVPEGFPPPPPKVGRYLGSDQASYIAHMRKKLLREQWEGYLGSYLKKKELGDKEAMQRILKDIKAILDEARKEEAPNSGQEEKSTALPEGFPPPPPIVGKFVGFLVTDRVAYKEHMRKKLMRQTWEIALEMYRKKQEERDLAALPGIIQRLIADMKSFEPCPRFIDTSNLPDGFPPPPPKIGELFKCTSEQEYKEYMFAKYIRDTWEDSLELYRKKQAENDKVGMDRIVSNLLANQARVELHKSRKAASQKKRKKERESMAPSPETTTLTKKLYELDNLLSPSELNTDAKVQARVLILLQELMGSQTTHPQIWRPEDTDLFDQLKQHLEGQLKHIFTNFNHYCEELDHVDIKTLLKLLESLCGKNEVPSILEDCFQKAAKTTYVLHSETASENHQNSRAVKLTQVIKMVHSTVKDDLERTTRVFMDHVNPISVSVEVFYNLLSKETTLLCGLSDSDVTEMLLLYKAYAQAVDEFKEYCPNLVDANCGFDKWVNRWIESVLAKFATWMDRFIETDRWEPVSTKVLYSVGILSIQDSIRQNFETIKTIHHNQDYNIKQFVSIACNTLNYYLSKLKDVFINTTNSYSRSTAWTSLNFPPDVLKFFEQSNPHITLTISNNMCTQINNLYGVTQLLRQFQEECKPLLSPTARENIDLTLFQPAWARRKDFKKAMTQHVCDLMKIDLQQCLKFFSHGNVMGLPPSPSPSNRASNTPSDPLFTYLNHQLSILNPKLHSEIFKSFLKTILRTLIAVLNGYLDSLAHQQGGLLEGLGGVLNRNKTSPSSLQMANKVTTLTEELAEWIYADGDGLPKELIQKELRPLRMRLDFWVAPSRMIIDTYLNTDENFEVPKSDLWNILQSRRNEDNEAKEFIVKNGGSFVSNMFGGSNPTMSPTKEEGGGGGRSIVSTLFGSKRDVENLLRIEMENANASSNNSGGDGGESKPSVAAPAETTILSAIFDWFG